MCVVRKYEIQAQNPDDFIVSQFYNAPAVLCSVAKNCRARLKNPKFDVDRYLQNLEKQKLKNTVAIFKKCSELI